MIIETERLIIRQWRDEDRPHYAAFNADPVVREYFYPLTKTEAETYTMVDGMISDFARDGFGFLAVERKSDGAFIGEAGFTRIDQPTQDAMIRPAAVEIGWLFGKQYWGFGYATEAAGASLAHGWRVFDFPEVVALACAANARSRRVMEKLGMTCSSADDFEDPTVPVGHWQRPHVVYRARRPA